MNTFSELCEAADEFALNFYNSGLTVNDFQLFPEAFIWSILQMLGDDFSMDERKAWRHFWDFIILVMHNMDDSLNNHRSIDTRIEVVKHDNSKNILNLRKCKLTTVPSLSNLLHLQKLYLSGNTLTTLPFEISLLQELMVLDLSNNKFKSLPDFLCSLEKLTHLYLHHNSLSQLPSIIGKLYRLRKLIVHHNKLTTSGFNSIFRLQYLDTLDVSFNKIKSIPWQLYMLRELKTLLINDNPIKKPTQLTFESIKQYLHSTYFSGTVKPKTIKVAILGCECAGKTSLLSALKKETVEINNLSTDGIEISDWNITRDIRLSCFDYAGQEVYYDNHTLFLSPSAIYILVYNMTEDNQSALTYWLRTIAVVASSAPIILVGTRVDVQKEDIQFSSEQALNLATTCGVQNQIKSSFEVSCTEGTNIDSVRNCLIQLGNSTIKKREAIPKSFVRLKEAIIEMRELYNPPILPWSTHIDICNQCNVESDQIQEANEFLVQVGVVMFLQSCSATPQHSEVIIDPSWLTQITSSIYSFSHTFGRKNGVMKFQDLQHIWRSISLEDSLHAPLLSLLESVDIITSLSENTILIPSFLPEERPSSVWVPDDKTKKLIVRRYDFKFAPKGFFTRCLVRLIQLGGNYIHWKSGIFWENAPWSPGAPKVLVTFSETTSQVNIFAAGDSYDGSSLYILTQIIESTIHNVLINENSFSPVVPLPRETVKISKLESLLLAGVDSYTCESGSVYPLYKIIPDLSLSGITVSKITIIYNKIIFLFNIIIFIF